MDERIIEREEPEVGSLLGDSEFVVARKHYHDTVAPQEDARVRNYLHSVEDFIEQNDNALDGVINNLPDPDPATERAEALKAKEKESLREDLRRQIEETPHELPKGPRRVFFTDGEERVYT